MVQNTSNTNTLIATNLPNAMACDTNQQQHQQQHPQRPPSTLSSRNSATNLVQGLSPTQVNIGALSGLSIDVNNSAAVAAAIAAAAASGLQQPQQHLTGGSGGVGGGASSGISMNTPAGRYPPNHPLSGSKHLCAICEDRASGKHYGVYSCEGCKGFFKRTVRKDLTYTCRDDSNQKCTVDKRQRNRCQYCRYQKCLEMGMKREAVQEERQRTRPENEVESSTPNNVPNPSTPNQLMNNVTTVNNNSMFGSKVTSMQTVNSTLGAVVNNNNNNNNHDVINRNSVDAQNIYFELTIERIMDAQKLVEVRTPSLPLGVKAAIKEIELLFRWIRILPYFQNLHIDDRVVLVKTAWNELLIAEISYRSIHRMDSGLVLANGSVVTLERVDELPQDIMKRIRDDLVYKFREMKMDQIELGCLRAIVLLNPALKTLKDENKVEMLRDRVFQILEMHCRQRFLNQSSRFAKLVANRLPALRSIGLKCSDFLFFSSFLKETTQQMTIDNFIKEMFQNR